MTEETESTDTSIGPETRRSLKYNKVEENPHSVLEFKKNSCTNKKMCNTKSGKKISDAKARNVIGLMKDNDFLEPSFPSGISRRILLPSYTP